MIGHNPTLGFIVIMQGVTLCETVSPLKAQLNRALLVLEENWHQEDENKEISLAILGGKQHEVLLYHQTLERMSAVFLAFDEDQIVLLARQTGLTISELLSPYVLVFEQMLEVQLIGIGFELSIPNRDDDESLKNAGIAIAFIQDKQTGSWKRKELLPVVGHYL